MNTKKEVKKKILKILESIGVVLDESESDLNIELDSIKFLQLIIAIEEEFKINLNYIVNKNTRKNNITLTDIEEWING